MNIQKIVSINNIIISRKSMDILIVQSFEVLPENNGYRFILESFTLN